MSDENVRDRREMLLKAVGDGDAGSINPRDYTEKLLAEAAEGEETRSNAREHVDLFINNISGGDSPTISTLYADKNDHTYDGSAFGETYNPVIVQVRPVKTIIRGTAGSIYGSDDPYPDFITKLLNGSLTASLIIDGTSIGFGFVTTQAMFIGNSQTTIFFSSSPDISASGSNVVRASYDQNGVLISCSGLVSGQYMDLTSMVGSLPTVLNILAL